MVDIVEVKSKKDLRRFVTFVNDLYKDNEYFVPDLVMDEMNSLRKDKNPAFEFSEAEFFLAKRGRKIVGRIGVMVNHRANEKWNQKRVRFTHFDFIDDYEVSSVLMEKAIGWAGDHGYDSISGPQGLTDIDHQGMLVEGFDEMDMFITIYNAPYYAEHMEKLGFRKEIDWIEYRIPVPTEPVERYSRIAEIVKRKYGFRVLEFSRRKDILPWAEKIFELYNAAYSPLFGTSSLSEKQIDTYIDTFFGFVNPAFIKVVLNEKDDVIGFGIALPSLARAMQKSKGRLFPFGFIHILKAMKKNDILDLYLIGVRDEYKGSGASTLIIQSMLQSAIDEKIKFAETGPELEDNTDVQAMWKYVERRQHRRRRVYIKELS